MVVKVFFGVFNIIESKSGPNTETILSQYMEYIQTQLNYKSDKWSGPNTETILSQYMEYIQTQLNFKSDEWSGPNN